MSKPFLSSDILYTQRFLSFCGYYTGKLDGIHGPKTEAAIHQFDLEYSIGRDNWGEFDPRTEINIYTLIPQFQLQARQCLNVLSHTTRDITIRVISGTRSYAEQNNLYKIGRYGDKRPRVTNARGGQSNHNFGIAFDIGIFKQGTYITSVADYINVGKQIMSRPDLMMHTEWGGNWPSFKDYPHYQLHTGKSVHAIRGLFESGKSLNLST